MFRKVSHIRNWIGVSVGVGLYMNSSPMRIYSKDKICRSENVLVTVAQIYSRAGKEAMRDTSLTVNYGYKGKLPSARNVKQKAIFRPSRAPFLPVAA